MAKHGKNYRKAAEQVDRERLYTPLQAAGIDKGSGEPHKTKVASISRAQVREIAQTKLPDLNANDLDHAERIIAGTARSMGITVSD